MDKMIQNKTCLICAFGLLFSYACTDLSENLMSDISAEEHYSSAEGIYDLTISMYDPLYEYYGYEAGELLTVTGTDEFTYAEGRRGLWNDYSDALNPTEDD